MTTTIAGATTTTTTTAGASAIDGITRGPRTRRIDAVVSVEGLDGRLERLLRHFEPCGAGNPAPVFGVERAQAAGARTVGEQHLRFTLDDGTGRLGAIGFGLGQLVEEEWLESWVKVAFRLEENEWRGVSSLQARVVDLRPTDDSTG